MPRPGRRGPGDRGRSGIADPAFEPREVHLIRLRGFSHTATGDPERPWIVYNSTSDFSGSNWIDVVDLRTCMAGANVPLAEKRERCRPQVFRMPFQPDWTRQRNWFDGQLRPGTEASCHDVTVRGGRLYCAALNATLVLDVSGLTDASGNVRGTPLPCTLRSGTLTGARVTDCSAAGPGSPSAEGWQFLGTFNHPGRDCVPPPLVNTTCNGNLFVPASEGVAVSHEADPSHDGKLVFVTDERGGGVVPPGASCPTSAEDGDVWNGGIHALDVSDPSSIRYALTPEGKKAVFRSDPIVPAATFCDVHVIEQVPGEQRIVAAYYSQGTKIVDYRVDRAGRVTFDEVAGIVLPNANTWVVQVFRVVKNPDGTRTYFFMASDINRGIDVFSWTGPPGPCFGARCQEGGETPDDLGLILLGSLLALPAIGVPLGRRVRRPGARGRGAAGSAGVPGSVGTGTVETGAQKE